MSIFVKDPTAWTYMKDEQGYKVYTLTVRVIADDNEDPQDIEEAPGLPQEGDSWDFFGRADDFSTRTPAVGMARASGTRSEGPAAHYDLTYTFTNRPPENQARPQRCNDTPIDDPLLEPPEISWDDVEDKEEAVFDRFGARITNSAHQQIRGAQNEWPINRGIVTISHNSPLLEYALCESMKNCVNRDWLWGCPPRTVRLKKFTARKLYYGQCYVYFKRMFQFEINYRGWDRDLLDDATKVLKGHWGSGIGTGTGSEGTAEWVLEDINGLPPDPENPSHFITAKDRNDENTKVILNGFGLPATKISQSLDVETIATSGNQLDLRVVNTEPDPEFQVNDRIKISNSNPPILDGVYRVISVVSTYRAIVASDLEFTDSPTYVDGAKIVNLDRSEQAGAIHVEKYPDADFLLLSLPFNLEE